jgi:hypothetical protein
MTAFSRVYNAALGISDRSTVSKQDVDITIEILKKMADQRNDWTQQDKDAYKLLADYAKEHYKGN